MNFDSVIISDILFPPFFKIKKPECTHVGFHVNLFLEYFYSIVFTQLSRGQRNLTLFNGITWFDGTTWFDGITWKVEDIEG